MDDRQATTASQSRVPGLLESVDRVLDQYQRWDAPTRAAVADRVLDHFVTDGGAKELSAGVLASAGVRQPAGTKVDARRILELVGVLVKAWVGLDDWGRVVWNQYAQDNTRLTPVSAAIGHALTAEGVDRPRAVEQLESSLADSMRRVQALLATLNQLPQHYAEKFAPQVIESAVGKPDPAACWRSYIAACGGRERHQLEQELREFWPYLLEKLRQPGGLPNEEPGSGGDRPGGGVAWAGREE